MAKSVKKFEWWSADVYLTKAGRSEKVELYYSYWSHRHIERHTAFKPVRPLTGCLKGFVLFISGRGHAPNLDGKDSLLLISFCFGIDEARSVFIKPKAHLIITVAVYCAMSGMIRVMFQIQLIIQSDAQVVAELGRHYSALQRLANYASLQRGKGLGALVHRPTVNIVQ